jgi:chaperonin GroES
MTEAKTVDNEVSTLVQTLLSTMEERLTIDHLIPLKDRVLVKPMEKENVHKKGNLYVVESDENKVRRQLVLACGDAVQGKVDVKVGDIVLSGRYVGHMIEWGGENYRLLPWQDILAVVDTETED